MNIFLIIGLTFLISVFILAIFGMIADLSDNYKLLIIGGIVSGVMWVIFILIGIGITTHNERLFVAKYLAQKDTIEQSIGNENLTGLERVQLVNNATELNGEFAERKARFELWYFVVYDNTIYDNTDLIKLKGE